MQNTARTVARNSNLKFVSSQLDHFFSKRTRQGADAFYTRKTDSAIAEAIQGALHTLLTNEGRIMFRLQPGVVTVSEFVEQIVVNRTQVFLSPEAINIMATQLDGRFTSQYYIRVTEHSGEWNMRWLTRLATNRGLSIDSIKSILYPTQLYEDAIDHINDIHTYIRQTSHSRHTLEAQRKVQDLLIAGQKYVSPRLSILANFYDSMQYARDNSEGVTQRSRIHHLVHEYNRLADLANGLYSGSVKQLRVPPLGRIVPIEGPIFQADKRRYSNQWWAGSATETQGKRDLLRGFNETVLSTNGIDPGLELAGLETVQFL